MIIGIGIDVIETARIAEKLNRNRGFREKIFSLTEIAYCERMTEPMQHFAGRFAAKEALLKALGFGLTGYLELKDAAIVNDKMGAPSFNFSGEMSGIIQERRVSRIYVSISHIHLAACAVVILEE